MSREFMDNLAAQLGIPKEKQAALDVGSNHPFTCRCSTCRDWWKLMGPENAPEVEEGEEPEYGPFTKEEIEG